MGATDYDFSGVGMEDAAARTGQLAVYGVHLFDIGDIAPQCDARFVRLSRIGWSRCGDSHEAVAHVRGFLTRWARDGKVQAQLAPGFGLVANPYGEITHRIGFDGTLRVVNYIQCGPASEAAVPRIWQFTLAHDEDHEARTYEPGYADTWAAFLMGKIKRKRPYADVLEE